MRIAAEQSFKYAATKTFWVAVFLVAIFTLANPFIATSGEDLDQAMQLVEKGNTQREMALLFLGVFALVTFISKKYRPLRVNGLLGWSMLFYVGLAIASPAWAEDPLLTIRRAGVLVLLVLGSLAVVARFSRIQTMALAVYSCGFTLAISLALEIVSGNFHPFDGTWRFSGTIYSVGQGWNCGLLAMGSLALARILPRSRKSLIFLAAIAFLFLVLTRSRMPLVSTVVALAVVGSLTSLKTRKLSFALAYAFLLSAGLLWFALYILGGNGDKTARSIASMGRGQEATSSLTTFTGREDLWEAEIGYAASRPLLGYGYDAFLNSTNLAAVSQDAGFVPASAHSGFIGTLLGLGCLGVATFGLALVLALKRSIRLARGAPDAEFAAVVMIWMCCNLFLESSIITSTSVPTFICFVILVSLAFEKESPCRQRFAWHSSVATPELFDKTFGKNQVRSSCS